VQEIEDAIRRKYTEAAISIEGKFGYPTGSTGAEALGYDPAVILEAPASLRNFFCGVGNPFSLGSVQPGSNVLDVGSGAGFDLYVAKRLAGEAGRVCGMDLTPKMVDLARRNLAAANMQDIEVALVSSEKIPYGDNEFDLVISNGVINLSPCKGKLFREIYRVLKNNGKLQFADIVLEEKLPSTLVNSLEAWSQ
jgi:arsenite methyltransferase